MQLIKLCPQCNVILNDEEELVSVGWSLMCNCCYQEYCAEYDNILQQRTQTEQVEVMYNNTNTER